MFIKRMTVGFLETNCYILACEETKEAAIIDPGASPEVIYEEVVADGFTVKYILLTHGHFDHVMGVDYLRAKTGAKVVIGKKDTPFLTSDERDGVRAHTAYNNQKRTSPDIEVEEGDTIKVGNLTCLFINTPGHTIGGMCIIVEDVIFSGDTLFYENCGRCDFATGSYPSMLKSLKRLALLEGDYKVYPGHGEPTVLSHERKANPYMLEGLKCK